MIISYSDRRFQLFRKLVLFGLTTLFNRIEEACPSRHLKIKVKSVKKIWIDLGPIITHEVEESGSITRYTYIQIQFFIKELENLGEKLLKGGVHKRWANRTYLAADGLRELLDQNAHLFLSTQKNSNPNVYLDMDFGDQSKSA